MELIPFETALQQVIAAPNSAERTWLITQMYKAFDLREPRYARGVDLLEKYLGDRDPLVRAAALRGLCVFRPVDRMKPWILHVLFAETDDSVLRAAADAVLANIKRAEDIPMRLVVWLLNARIARAVDKNEPKTGVSSPYGADVVTHLRITQHLGFILCIADEPEDVAEALACDCAGDPLLLDRVLLAYIRTLEGRARTQGEGSEMSAAPSDAQ